MKCGRSHLLFSFIWLLFGSTLSLPFGAPDTACEDQIPQHNSDRLSGRGPYNVSITNQGNVLTVTVAANGSSDFPSWRGLLITARDRRGRPAGSLIDTNQSDYRPQCDNGVTHVDNSEKCSAQFKWDIPDTQNIKIHVTIVRDLNTFWVFRRTHIMMRNETPTTEQPIIRDVIDARDNRGRPGPDDLTTPEPTAAAPDLANDGSRPRTEEPIISMVAPADLGDDNRRNGPHLAPANIGEDSNPTTQSVQNESTIIPTTTTTTTTPSTTNTRSAFIQIEAQGLIINVETQRLDECGVTVSQIERAIASPERFIEDIECVFRYGVVYP